MTINQIEPATDEQPSDPAHPDQVSPMTVGPEHFYEEVWTPTLAEELAERAKRQMIDTEREAFQAAQSGDKARQSIASTESERHRAVYHAMCLVLEDQRKNSIPRAENCGRYLAEVNDGRLLYLNHAGSWQESPNFIARIRSIREETIRECSQFVIDRAVNLDREVANGSLSTDEKKITREKAIAVLEAGDTLLSLLDNPAAERKAGECVEKLEKAATAVHEAWVKSFGHINCTEICAIIRSFSMAGEQSQNEVATSGKDIPNVPDDVPENENIKRYDLQYYLQEDSEITENEEGAYVKYDDYVALHQERQISARAWRKALDDMHQRAMNAESDLKFARREADEFRATDLYAALREAEEMIRRLEKRGFTVAALATGEVSVKVKPLEWNEYDDEQGIPDRWDAEASNFGVFYNIEIQHDGYRAVFDHEAVGAIGVFDSLEAAKAAAQAHHDKCILSAIEQHSAEPVGWHVAGSPAITKDRDITDLWKLDNPNAVISPVYTHPPVTAGWEKALEDAKTLGAGYVMVKPNGSTTHVPVDDLALSNPPQAVAEGLEKEVQFLLDRLEDFERSMLSESIEASYRDWCGHVQPPMARLRAALKSEGRK